jgi:hypothetical protein
MATIGPLLNYNLALTIGDIYNLNSIAPGILQATYSNAKLTAKGDYDLAIKFTNVNSLHAAIYPILINTPNGTSIYPNNPKAYEYYIFKLPSNITIALQSSWIVANSVQLVTGLGLSINVNNLGSYSDVTRILNAIYALGYTSIDSNIVNYTP